MSNVKKYQLEIEPAILELLGPSLYTNIYYVLSELIANAYDADASNVYIINNPDKIVVEDDGSGMSYDDGVQKYLKVAQTSRTNEANSITPIYKRRRMGRKGVGKLAALSVSENVRVMTVANGDKSGFVLSRNVKPDRLLQPITEKDIKFEKISSDGTSIVMDNPQLPLHVTPEVQKRNILRLFPLLSNDFKIHIINDSNELVIDSFDHEIIPQLATLRIIGSDFADLKNDFTNDYPGSPKPIFDECTEPIVISEYTDPSTKESKKILMRNNSGEDVEIEIQICGWIGNYRSTKEHKAEASEFSDNFISILANDKLGTFNILPEVGKNRLTEVYVVGQLHIDIFERTDLPDMALSNRQGYKSGDIRYQIVKNYIRDNLLPEVLEMRVNWADQKNLIKKERKNNEQKQREEEFKRAVEEYKVNTASKIVDEFANPGKLGASQNEKAKSILNENLKSLGIKPTIDANKKKILISHKQNPDSDFASVVYDMLLFNNIPKKDVLYTSTPNNESRPPASQDLYEYLRDFFVESASDQLIHVIFITSDDFGKAWNPILEAGAAWVVRSTHSIFNIHNYNPLDPLNVHVTYQNTKRDFATNDLCMTDLEIDIFIRKIIDICNSCGYSPKSDADNKNKIKTLVKIVRSY
jgi:hypothetical protein